MQQRRSPTNSTTKIKSQGPTWWHSYERQVWVPTQGDLAWTYISFFPWSVIITRSNLRLQIRPHCGRREDGRELHAFRTLPDTPPGITYTCVPMCHWDTHWEWPVFLWWVTTHNFENHWSRSWTLNSVVSKTWLQRNLTTHQAWNHFLLPTHHFLQASNSADRESISQIWR